MKISRLSKFEIAESQLHHAITLFIEERELVSAITLAGAAEEIFGRLVEKVGLAPSLTRRAESARSLHIHLWKKDPGIRPYINLKNSTKNELKHLVSGEVVELDMHNEAMRLLDRAVENYKLLQPRLTPSIRIYKRKRNEIHEARTDAP